VGRLCCVDGDAADISTQQVAKECFENARPSSC
jgi:hypothetical protein